MSREAVQNFAAWKRVDNRHICNHPLAGLCFPWALKVAMALMVALLEIIATGLRLWLIHLLETEM